MAWHSNNRFSLALAGAQHDGMTDEPAREVAWTPRNPAYEARVRDSFARQGFMTFVGARIGLIAPGRCVLEAPYRLELTQQHGYFHGGLIGALADSAAGYAAFTLADADASILTVEFKVNLLEPGHGALLRADARVLRAGRRIATCQADVCAGGPAGQTRCAVALVTLMYLAGRSDHAG
jgi:uncharacterized protein (TIGR00369 family)